MKARRDFIRQLVGYIGVLNDEFHGVEYIPLSNLSKLPDHIIRKIEPVFFQDETWEIRDQVFYISKRKSEKSFALNKIELLSIEYFKNNTSLEKTALEINRITEYEFKEIYRIVASLFF
jgi:hypothetical protein